MTGPGQHLGSGRTTLRSLLADHVLQLGLAAHAAALLLLAGSRFGLDGTAGEYLALIDPVLLGLTAIALAWARSRVAPGEQRFWYLLAAAWGCWLLVDLLYFFQVAVPLLSANLVTDALYIFYYLIFGLALDLRPHRGPDRTLPALGRRLESAAGLLAVFGLLVYLALVNLPEPLGLSLSFVSRDRGLTPVLLVRLSLDLMILGRLIYAAASSRGRWRRLYALLALGLLGYAARDALSLVQYERLIALDASGLGYQAFLYLPGLVVLCTARYRLLPEPDGDRDPADTEARNPLRLVRASPIALYALLVPAVHFLFYPLGLLEPTSRTPREVFSLAYVMILGALAWIHQSVMAKDERIARAALLEAEEQLLRAQRLESVGRLAGGIAHDFNNYLTVIRGYGELLGARLQDPEERADLEYIEDSARKATHLTRQLLAFGRRQVLRPKPLDLNAVVLSTSKMLASLLGEDVVLEIDLDPATGWAQADLGQTEQILVNLALNGRDAMPGGGTLSLKTLSFELTAEAASQLEIKPGPYVELIVADTGIGMSDEVRSQVFEPFFTTKPMGQGTGLGLSTVYGVVVQSGGAIRVESAPGAGTVVRVLLPSATEPAPSETVMAAAEPAAPGTASLLLVEDDEAVLRLISRALSQAGFLVRVASDGADAVARFLDSCVELDLLITDVLMPEMDGVEMAAVFQARCPSLKVLFLSGYPAETLRERQATLPQSTRLLEKPFSPSTLVAVVREILEEEPGLGTATEAPQP